VGIFSICCSTFSFLPNVGLRLILEYLTISPSSESHSSTTLIHSSSSGSILNSTKLLMIPHLYRCSHIYTGHACLKISIRKTFDTGSNCTRPSRKPTALIPLVGRIREGNWGDVTRMRNEPNLYKKMTPHSTQNLKALSLRVFFLYDVQLFHFYPMWDLDSHLNI